MISSEGWMSSKLANKPELPRKHQGLCFGHKYKVTFGAKHKNCAIMKADKKQQGLRAPTSCYNQKWIQCLSFERVIHQGIKSRLYGESVEAWEPIRARSVMEEQSTFGLRAFLRPIAHPPGASRASSGQGAALVWELSLDLVLIHPSSQASSSGQRAALVWMSFL